MSLKDVIITSFLVSSSGFAVGALGYFMWYKYKNKTCDKYYFLRKENKQCNLCFSKKQPYLCDNNLCSFDLILKIVAILNLSKEYIFLSTPFLEIEEIGIALVNAFNRGVDVRVINGTLDNPSKTTLSCLASGIPFKSLNYFSIMMHSKFIVVDNKTLLRGSLNFTKRCFMANYENFQVLYSPYRVSWYYDVFLKMWDEKYYWHPIPELANKLIFKDC